MSLAEYFPIWNKLTGEDQAALEAAAQKRSAPKGTLLHNGSADCIGLLVIRSGQLRAYLTSPEGREITVYRLFERDICLFSASCMLTGIRFDITIEAEKDSELFLIPAAVYKQLMASSATLSNYTGEIMASRLTDVMWLVEQVLWKSFDKRLAAFLIEESNIEADDTLHLTHEKIADHLGTAREVVTRMLNYFQTEGMVTLTRGTITLTDRKRLERLGG